MFPLKMGINVLQESDPQLSDRYPVFISSPRIIEALLSWIYLNFFGL